MKQKLLVPVINENFSFEDASSIYDKSLPDQAYNMVSKSYYPYYLFQANYQVPILFLQKQLSVNCMIDALNGQAATTDGFQVFETEVTHEDVLANCINKKQAKKYGKRYIINHLGRSLKCIANFDVSICFKNIVYKSFWVFEGDECSLVIDSVTGSCKAINISNSA